VPPYRLLALEQLDQQVVPAEPAPNSLGAKSSLFQKREQSAAASKFRDRLAPRVSITPIRKPKAADEAVELRELRADMRRRKQSSAAVPMLIAALEEQFGATGRFTVGTIMQVVDEDRHGALAEAVAQVIDMNASPRSRAVTLGALLTRLREVEVVAEQRGASIYRLRREYMRS
jgi:hypothetical protein